MVELVILACLLAEPATCDRFQVPFLGDLKPLQCLLEGQLHMKAWAEAHPSWQVMSWRCGPPEA